jgi:hypothetical protein
VNCVVSRTLIDSHCLIGGMFPREPKEMGASDVVRASIRHAYLKYGGPTCD